MMFYYLRRLCEFGATGHRACGARRATSGRIGAAAARCRPGDHEPAPERAQPRLRRIAARSPICFVARRL